MNITTKFDSIGCSLSKCGTKQQQRTTACTLICHHSVLLERLMGNGNAAVKCLVLKIKINSAHISKWLQCSFTTAQNSLYFPRHLHPKGIFTALLTTGSTKLLVDTTCGISKKQQRQPEARANTTLQGRCICFTLQSAGHNPQPIQPVNLPYLPSAPQSRGIDSTFGADVPAFTCVTPKHRKQHHTAQLRVLAIA